MSMRQNKGTQRPIWFLLSIDDDLRLFGTVMAARVGFFVGQEMHEFEFDAQMIEPFVNVFGQLDPEGLVEAGDVAHDMRLCEDVIVAEEGFVGRTVQRDDIAEHPPVFGLQLAQLPVHTLRRDQLFDLVELLAHERQLLLRPVASAPVERLFQRVKGGPPVFDEFAALQIVEKLFVFRIEQAPGDQEIELAAIEGTFDCGRIFDRGVGDDGSCALRSTLYRLLTRHENILLTSTTWPQRFPGHPRSNLWRKPGYDR